MDVTSARPSLRVVDAAAWTLGGEVEVAVCGDPAQLAVLLTDPPSVTVSPTAVAGVVHLRGGPAALRQQLAASLPGLLDHLDASLAAWRQPPPDLVTPAGTLPTATRPVVMGILNVTPDSFSDGGDAYIADAHPAPALAAAARLLDEGADVIDVGGESTRPGATPVDLDTELARVVPVVRELAAAGAVVSVDTTKAAVARAAIDVGAAIVNDVSAGARDPALLRTVAATEVPYILMHARGTPATMQQDPGYDDVVAEVHRALDIHLDRLVDLGIARERVVMDPGIGFAKTTAHNVALLRELDTFTAFGRPVLVGASRKRFIGEVTGVDDPRDRLEGSLAVAALAVASGARLLRVHDVAATRRAAQLAHTIGAPEVAGT